MPSHKKAVNYSNSLSKFSQVDLEQVKDMVSSGLTERQVALELGVTQSTITAWKRRHPHFRDALALWKYQADAKVERSLYERATGYTCVDEKIFCSKDGTVTRVETTKHYPPDVTAAVFWLKNRQRDTWRDRVEHEHSGHVDLATSILEARQRARVVNNEAEIQEQIDLLS
jgi:transcriptional regulator with XRE-family HTH domain